MSFVKAYYEPGKGGFVHGPQIALIKDDPNRSEVSNFVTLSIEGRYIGQPVFEHGVIGIGITTRNRPDTFRNTLEKLCEVLPENVIIAIVDDASTTEYMYNNCVDLNNSMSAPFLYRFSSNVGIARAKNKCLELLFDSGCDHFFLFDDDTYPLRKDWWKPYVNSREPHLMYIFEHFTCGKSPHDMTKIYADNDITAYSHVRGCMLYYKRICLYTVGGMDVAFGKWGHEHGDLSNRIYSAGLTRFRYMDVANSRGLFYSADEQEHGKFVSTVPGVQRIELLKKTQAIYDAQYNIPAYRQFRSIEPKEGGSPLFLTAYFTTLTDPQRPGYKWELDVNAITPYFKSVMDVAETYPFILSDNKPANSVIACTWEKVYVSINPYFQRWISYYEYLIKHKDKISWVFMTDCTDVELLKMPEPKSGFIYTGNEPDTIGKSTWLQFHHKHPDLLKFYQQHKNTSMLNAGILGGYIDDVLPFIRAIIDTYTRMQHDANTKRVSGPGMTDMAIFNYVGHAMFSDKIVHGSHVNTKFKANERNGTSWWKHK